jgi:hypothetical protein
MSARQQSPRPLQEPSNKAEPSLNGPGMQGLAKFASPFLLSVEVKQINGS